MPASFAKAPNGMLFIANGIDPVVRWDGLSTSAELAGVEGASSAVTMTGSGVGNIFGSLYGYCRFVDRLGRFSNLSPVGTAYAAKGIEKTVTAASNEAPIVITTANHALQTGQKIVVENVTGNTAANGTWTVTNIDADTFSLDGSAGNDTYRSGGTWHRGVSSITYSNIPVSTDAKVVTRQIFRTKVGDPNTVYLDLETTDLTSTSLTSTNADADLTSGQAITLTNGDDNLLNRHGVPPSEKSVLVHHIDRMFAMADVVYREGNVQVTNGSTSVVGIGTEWSAEFVGRYLFVTGGEKYYLISAIDLDTQTITLSEAYEGDTSKYATYAIRPDESKRRTVRWSESGLPESWNPLYEFSIQENRDSGEIVGGMSIDSWLYLLAENRIYRYTYQNDPLRDGFVFPDVRRGAVNHRCWVQVDEAAFLMDRQGIYRYFGNGQQEVSQPIQGMFQPEPTGPYKVNWNAAYWFHAAHDPVNETVRFFVALDGDYLPRHAICFHYRYDQLWLEEYPVPIGAAALGELNGRSQLYLGTDHGRVLAAGLGNLDGVDPLKNTVQGAVGSNTTLLRLCTGIEPKLTEADVVNDYVVITSGPGAGQRRRIVDVIDSCLLAIDQPWTEMPDTTSTWSIGGIEFTYRTGWFRYLQRDNHQNRRIELMYEPTADESSLVMRIYEDRSATAMTHEVDQDSLVGNGISTTKGSADLTIDTTKVSGYVNQSISETRWREVEGRRFMSLSLSGTQTKDRIRVYQIGLYGERM